MDNVKASGMDAAANQPNVKSPVGVSAPRRPRRTSERHARQLMRRAWWVVVGAIVPVGIWMSVAPLSMAVVAPGLVKVDLNRRPVQHLEGGIVREVLVRDGETVKAGDPVLMIGDVGVEADRNRLLYRANVERASVVRLDAEQSMSRSLVFPAELLAEAAGDERVQQALAKETALFEARRNSLESETALMRIQRTHVESEIAALRAQIAQAEGALTLQRRDLEMNRALVKDGFISPNRVTQIDATVTDYASKLEERRSELARAAQRLVDSDLKLKSIQNQYVQQASDQLKAAAARVAELEQELRKSEDQSRRQLVVAPASGAVMDLKFTSPGAVIRPGDTIAEIVPTDAKLMIEARIRPEDIGYVAVGQSARLRFPAFKFKGGGTVTGKVTYVSADRLVDHATNAPYYVVTIAADAASLEADPENKVQAGMPAEVYIDGARQTPLEYMAEPITSTIRRAGRQM